VDEKFFMTEEELAHEKQLAHEKSMAASSASSNQVSSASSSTMTVALAWLAVGLPLAWGVSLTIQKAAILFK